MLMVVVNHDVAYPLVTVTEADLGN